MRLQKKTAARASRLPSPGSKRCPPPQPRSVWGPPARAGRRPCRTSKLLSKGRRCPFRMGEERGGTPLPSAQPGYELGAVGTGHANREQNAFGFGMMMENLRALVEDHSLPYPGGF